jgi:hypothetical protein|tara:strand:- start:104 stop:910 length:807 start_codon:yes stop_codon:yes gene_type:complete
MSLSKPFTYYTIIGRDPSLLVGHLENVTNYAGFNKLLCEKKLLVIIYKNPSIPSKITETIIGICKKYNAEYVFYEEPHSIFIENLYACWNLGYQHSLDGFVFRGGSDQAFSKDSFVSLYNLALAHEGEKIILQANTIENANRNLDSRHFLEPLGDTFDDFSYEKFEEACERINAKVGDSLVSIDTALEAWGKPTPLRTSKGIINRVDGCSWLMTKLDWELYGPLPVFENGITGDVIIHDRLQAARYKSFIARDCITYHFVRGESKDIQ